MYCSKCGNQINGNANFCPNCGNVIKSNINNQINKESPVNNFSKKIKGFLSKLTIDRILLILIIVVATSIVFAVSYSFMRTKQSRVVMIYMVGSNLESRAGLATRDLRGLDYNKLTKNHTKVVLIAGGASSWKNNYIDVHETSIYALEEAGFVKKDIRDRTNMGTADNLSYFLNYVYSNYKASKYFIYWNHGGAVDGSEYDELAFQDNLDLQEMDRAFENSPFKKHKLEVMSFRTCLNGTIEVANVYKKYAKYLVASEEVTIGSNADSAIRFLNDVKISDTPVTYGKKEINVYKETVTNSCNDSPLNPSKKENYCVQSTYSITDLSKIDKLNTAFNKFSADINKDLNQRYSEYSKIRSNMKQYAGEDDPTYDMIDLYDLVDKFGKYSNNSSKVKKALKKAVVYNWTNTDFSNGLSVYFPYNSNAFLSFYSNISGVENYTNFIEDFYNTKSGVKTETYSSFSQLSGIATATDKKKREADIELELTEDQINNMAKASYIVFVDTNDGYYQPIYSGKDTKVEGGKLKATVKDRLLQICDKEYGDNCMWLLSTEKEVTESYVDLDARLLLAETYGFDSFISATATIRIDEKHKDGYINALYSNLEPKNEDQSKKFAVSAKEGLNITDYNFVMVLSSRYKVLDENGNYNPDWINTSNRILQGTSNRTNMFKFKRQDFSDGYNCYVVFKIHDIANNEYYSKPIKVNG